MGRGREPLSITWGGGGGQRRHNLQAVCGPACGRHAWKCVLLHVSFFTRDRPALSGLFFTRSHTHLFYKWVFFTGCFFSGPLPTVRFFTLEFFYTTYVFFSSPGCFFTCVFFFTWDTIAHLGILHVCFYNWAFARTRSLPRVLSTRCPYKYIGHDFPGFLHALLGWVLHGTPLLPGFFFPHTLSTTVFL